MRIIKIEKENKNLYFSAFLMSLLLLANLCFSTSNVIFLYVLIVGLNACFLFLRLAGKIHKKGQIKISLFLAWLFVFHLWLALYGNCITPVTDGSQYSFLYHMLTLCSIVLSYFHIWLYKGRLFFFFRSLAIMGTLIICVYVLLAEWPMLKDKIALIMLNESWYRLGNYNSWNSNSIALHLSVLSIIMGIVFYAETNRKYRFIECLFIALQLLVILLAGSKKGIFLFLVAFVAMGVIRENKKERTKNILLSLLVLIVAVYLVFFNPFFYNLIGDRIVGMFGTLGLLAEGTFEISNSTDLRQQMIADGIELFFESPIVGNGWGAFAVYRGSGMYSHNNFTEILSSMGIVGFLLYYSIYFYLLYINMKLNNKQTKKTNLILLASVLFIDFASITAYGSMVTYILLSIIYVNSFSKNSYK